MFHVFASQVQSINDVGLHRHNVARSPALPQLPGPVLQITISHKWMFSGTSDAMNALTLLDLPSSWSTTRLAMAAAYASSLVHASTDALCCSVLN